MELCVLKYFLAVAREENITKAVGILVHEGEPLAQKDAVTPENLADVPLILTRQELVQHRAGLEKVRALFPCGGWAGRPRKGIPEDYF